METAIAKYEKRDFWIEENQKYCEPHFRLTKAAQIVNRLAAGRERVLLDVGCGPATLRRLLNENIHYYGVDIAIHEQAPNLLELDFVANPIAFGGKRFDIIVAQGIFEYIGEVQAQKLQEISQLLNNKDSKVVISYVNFNHLNRSIYRPYNNIQLFEDFRSGLEQFFYIEKFFPTSQRWHHDEPRRGLMKAVQTYLNLNIPFVSRMFAVEYFFICRPRLLAV